MNGKIYKITNDVSDKLYIGSSTNRLCTRMNKHRFRCKDTSGRNDSNLYLYMREIGVEHFKIELIEQYECETKEELREREQHWIEQLTPELNTFRAIANPNYKKEYYCSHKDEQNKKMIEYYYSHKTQILAKLREKITCECGAIYNRSTRAVHFKTKKHNRARDTLELYAG